MAQCQCDVPIFQEIQKWQEDEVGWSFSQGENVGKAAIAVRRNNMSLWRHRRTSTRWVLIVLETILFLSLCLPHTWGGDANLEEYYRTLKEVDRNMQDIKQKLYISGNSAGMDAQVEVKPHQQPFVGGGTGNGAKYCEMESNFERYLMEWVTKHDVKLANTFCDEWDTQGQKQILSTPRR